MAELSALIVKVVNELVKGRGKTISRDGNGRNSGLETGLLQHVVAKR